MKLFPKQKELIEKVKESKAGDGLTTLKIIWGQRAGKTTVIEEMLDCFHTMLVSDDPTFQDRAISYRSSLGDLEVELRNICKFKGTVDVLILEDFDWSGLSLWDSSKTYSTLRDLCEELDVKCMLILTAFNKPSLTENVFDGKGVEQKLATFEVNELISEGQLVEHFDVTCNKFKRDFYCV